MERRGIERGLKGSGDTGRSTTHRIVRKVVAPSKAIIEVDARTGSIVAHIVNHSGVGGQLLGEATGLLAEHPHLVDVVPSDSVVVGVRRRAAINANSGPQECDA